MEHWTHRILGIAAGLCIAAPLWAAGLHLDGMLLVQGQSLEGARVIIVGHGKEPLVLTRSLAHFNLELELNSEYLFSFERPGCITKQLRFNTEVPQSGDDYYFPFQVTLAPPPQGQSFTYAGPVGHIRYDRRLEDFAYDTDYRTVRNEKLEKQVELARLALRDAGMDRSAPVSPVSLLQTGKERRPVRHGDMDGGQSGFFGTRAGTVSQMAPLVHVVEHIQRTTPALGLIEPHEAMVAETPQMGTVLAAAPPPKHTTTADGLFAQRKTSRNKTTEVLVSKLHVITIVRVHADGQQEEYRRVASYYGGVAYFKNGTPCTEALYRRELAR